MDKRKFFSIHRPVLKHRMICGEKFVTAGEGTLIRWIVFVRCWRISQSAVYSFRLISDTLCPTILWTGGEFLRLAGSDDRRMVFVWAFG